VVLTKRSKDNAKGYKTALWARESGLPLWGLLVSPKFHVQSRPLLSSKDAISETQGIFTTVPAAPTGTNGRPIPAQSLRFDLRVAYSAHIFPHSDGHQLLV
jgi:hypothetical protein